MRSLAQRAGRRKWRGGLMSEYPETKEAETDCAALFEAVLALRLDGQRGMPLTDFPSHLNPYSQGDAIARAKGRAMKTGDCCEINPMQRRPRKADGAAKRARPSYLVRFVLVRLSFAFGILLLIVCSMYKMQSSHKKRLRNKKRNTPFTGREDLE